VAIDTSYCYGHRCTLQVVCVRWSRPWALQKSWTDRVVIWRTDSHWPNEPHIAWGPRSPIGKVHFKGDMYPTPLGQWTHPFTCHTQPLAHIGVIIPQQCWLSLPLPLFCVIIYTRSWVWILLFEIQSKWCCLLYEFDWQVDKGCGPWLVSTVLALFLEHVNLFQ